MIAVFSDDESYDSCRTDGCSCCSLSLHPKRDKEEILEYLVENYEMVLTVLKYYKIPFSKFKKMVESGELKRG